jgi:hypothetical protein
VPQWGAIATNGKDGSFGAVTSMPNKTDAEVLALAICKSKHGSTCKLEFSYANQCAAMVASDNGYNTTSGPTQDDAINQGMQICHDANNSNCFVYYADCSRPLRIQ